jgi:hypothetical protein
MKDDIDVNFEHIYTNMDETDNKMNKNLLSEQKSQEDSCFCYNWCNPLCMFCCFFLYT